MSKIEWTEADEAKANSEGWTIATFATMKGIDALPADSPNFKFANHRFALQHVRQQARAGVDPMYQRALEYVTAYNLGDIK